MIPYKDINPSRRVPIVTIVLIALNSCVFFYELLLGGPGAVRFIYQYATIPFEFKSLGNIYTSPGIPPPLSILTAMFIHGGWFHLIGNMLYLWIFGDNVEDQLGRLRFTLFYLLCGITATLAHILTNLDSQTPTIGASGAIAGVLGAYIRLFPHARIKVLVPIFYYFRVVIMPAWFVLGIWILMQVLEVSFSSYSPKGGIAYAAHIGGFITGLIFIHFFARRRR